MELVDRKSMNESVDDLMPNTVDEASRRRSNPQDELQRILAYTAQVRINKVARHCHCLLCTACFVLTPGAPCSRADAEPNASPLPPLSFMTGRQQAHDADAPGHGA
jgi:hypothetical protein